MRADQTKQQDVHIRQAPIELSSFLKLAQVVMSGGEAKALIQSGQVMVNGEVETRRSRSLNVDDVVTVQGAGRFRVRVQ